MWRRLQGLDQQLAGSRSLQTIELVCVDNHHRISAVQAADHILVLDDGRVLEEGDHAALAAGGGLYARLYERQRLAAEIEGAG